MKERLPGLLVLRRRYMRECVGCGFQPVSRRLLQVAERVHAVMMDRPVRRVSGATINL